ncbi:MAG: rhomboid family intramembrane serine protease, partial [Gemmataceae bacterium]
FNFIHLVFNMLWLKVLGQAIEHVRGRTRFLAMVLVIAILSNVSQFFFQISLDRTPWLNWQPSPFFGGMSGVVYGLFGYVWMKQRFEPQLGLGMSKENIVIMIGWLVICAMNWMGPVANTAHLVGLLAGMVLGVAGLLFRRR